MAHSFKGMAAAGAIMAVDSLPDLGSDAVSAVERLGLAIALVVFFVVTGWKREQRMAKRLDWLEKENDKLSNKLATLGEQVNQTLLHNQRFMQEHLSILNSRTCYAFANREEFERHQREFAAKE
jgi:hypothetical protein